MITLDEYLEIKELFNRGLSKKAIASKLGLDRKTVRKYLKGIEGMPRYRRSSSENILDPFREYVEKRVAQGCTNGMVLLREIKDRGYQGGYTILKDFIRPLRKEYRWWVELRWEAPRGEYAQVDWGHFTARLPDGPPVRLYAFVFTLAYSRFMYVEWTKSRNLEVFKRCHENAFAYVGGVPKCINYDRMKTVVLEGEEEGKVHFHPGFLDFARYYGFIPRLCPKNWPRGKGKVESGVKYVRRNFYQGLQSFTEVEDLNGSCRDWLNKVANIRIHGTTGRIPLEMLPEEGLLSLQGKPTYPLHPVIQRTVSRDCLVSYQGCRYSVPNEWAGKGVWVRKVGEDRIAISAEGRIIAEHLLEPTLKRTILKEEHYASLRGRPRLRENKWIPSMVPFNLEVEQRPLREYAALVEEGLS